MKRRSKAGFVYAVECDSPGRPVKFGHRGRGQRRLHTLQVGNPFKLKIIVEVPSLNAMACEAALLQSLDPEHRIRGEWFRRSPEVRSAIDLLVEERGRIYARFWARTNADASGDHEVDILSFLRQGAA